MNVFLAFALITAGISLAMGTLSLVSGLSKEGERIDLLFGIMCLSVFIFFIFPPIGFITTDQTPGDVLTIPFKRVFNFLNVALMPWFFLEYTGYKKKVLPVTMDIIILITWLVMFYSGTDSTSPRWVSMALVPLTLLPVHGFIACRYQYKSGEEKKAGWLFVCLIIYMLFYLPTVFNQVTDNYLGKLLRARVFYPVNLFPLVFMFLMGIRLRSNLNDRILLEHDKYKLERWLRNRDIRWESLLNNIQFLVVQLDLIGNIRNINPYAITLLGYRDISELAGKNWFDYFVPREIAGSGKNLFQDQLSRRQFNINHTSSIICNSGDEKKISWSTLLTYNDDGQPEGVVSLGVNITEMEEFVIKVQELKSALEKEKLMLEEKFPTELMDKEIIGKSEAIQYALRKARQVASTNATVLLEGETGVGKELFANLIQGESLRNTMPFIKVNCGALPAELIEDELFGHEKGAFTGAVQIRKGRFEMANGGTIFLDEIGELPLSLQPKMLRVLQNGEFERIGGQQTLKVDVRVIAATNRTLSREVMENRFREDLFFRLNVFPITIPPLRNRQDDVHLLIRYFIAEESRKHGRQLEDISKADLNHLIHYHWPGNIRELRNVIERAVISSSGKTLKIDPVLPFEVLLPASFSKSTSLEQIEKDHILRILQQCNWQIAGVGGAAEILTIHPSTLRSRMKKLNISRQD